MPKAARLKRTKPVGELGIRDLISYRISRTASLMSRSAALRYRREFDVSLGEWRALALLGTGAPQSLMQLSRAAGLDKAQMSRVVASLTGRGLVLRQESSEGGRSIELSLTEHGRETYAGLIAAAAERDRLFRTALEPDELTMLNTLLSKLSDKARDLIAAEASSGPEVD
jgi:DNA-binding MarR family transcriptional regulator